MSKRKQIAAFRVSPELSQEIDDVAAEMKQLLRGVEVGRSAVIRMLIIRGLDDFRKAGA